MRSSRCRIQRITAFLLSVTGQLFVMDFRENCLIFKGEETAGFSECAAWCISFSLKHLSHYVSSIAVAPNDHPLWLWIDDISIAFFSSALRPLWWYMWNVLRLTTFQANLYSCQMVNSYICTMMFEIGIIWYNCQRCRRTPMYLKVKVLSYTGYPQTNVLF